MGVRIFTGPMPELPEVETVCRGLQKLIQADDPIERIEVVRYDLREPVSKSLAKKFIGARVQRVQRRAKYILLETDRGLLISHLGMSGSWRSFDGENKKHDHIHIYFRSGQQLTYHDPRRFGLFFNLPNQDLSKSKWLKNLGVEPLAEDFTAEYLFDRAQKKSLTIKNYIMDQKVVVGIGNIYASEVLFWAQILPHKKISKLKMSDWVRVVQATHKVLNFAIQYKGTTLRDYKQANSQTGEFQNELATYGRTNQKCMKCSALIKHKIMNARSTYWCPKCQR